ncbi:MAG: glycosyltransferase family A protein [Ignavibacteriaceae bacterium]
MDGLITTFIFCSNSKIAKQNADQFRFVKFIKDTIIVSTISATEYFHDYHSLHFNSIYNSNVFRKIYADSDTKYILLLNGDVEIRIDEDSIYKFIDIAESNAAGLVYSDYYELSDNKTIKHPTINYQIGSIRDNFDFGPIVVFKKDSIKKFYERNNNYNFAGLYSLRLSVSENFSVFRIPEYLYTARMNDIRKSGEMLFDYVDPQNRDVQIEMEEAFTFHLEQIGAYLAPIDKLTDLGSKEFEYEASVIIPVRNREKTIKDALQSALKQHTNFSFNVIIVDNHSSDSTTQIIRDLSKKGKNIIHIIPPRTDLGIGGCWNEAIHNSQCGKFAVQLDSDDLYLNEHTLQNIVNKFYQNKCAMIIGSYRLTDFDKKEIPPGIIDHAEWSDVNGHNNALRINGLGAPRAFYTPVIREINFPNVSYGEDYAVALAILRDYKIGRIYEPIYLCRRWDGNTDSNLSIEQQNANDYYKDSIRTAEIKARQKKNNYKFVKQY